VQVFEGLPGYIGAALAVDVSLVAVNAVDLVMGYPFERWTRFIALDGEANLPTWFSSIQWFCVAALFWLFAQRAWRRGSRRYLALLALPAVFLAFSLDEVATLHESLGGVLDRIIVNRPRLDTALPETGFWFVLIGVPFVIAFIVLLILVRPAFAGARPAFTKLGAGMAVFLLGAIGAEALSNFVVRDTPLGAIQVMVEEGLELIGSTIVLWGAWDLAFGRASAANGATMEPRGGTAG
jgi:hypothetical protein